MRTSGGWLVRWVVWFSLCAAASAVAAGDRAAEVLAHARAAAGSGWAQVSALSWEGEMDTAGLSGTITGIEDLVDGRYVTEYALGELKGAQGDDGTNSWMRAPGGESVPTDSPGARGEASNQRWFTRRGYLRADLGGATVAYLKHAREGQRGFDVVQATPPGGRAIELWFDARTHQLARTVDATGDAVNTQHYDDYREVAGMVIAHRLRSDQGDARYTTEIRITAVRSVAMPEAARFAMPASRTDDVHFASATKSVTVPFELINNHIYIEARINGQPVRLLVDTGGVNLVTREAVQRLGLTVEGKIQGRGTGEHTVDVGMSRAKSLQIGALTLDAPQLFVFDLGELMKVEGVQFDGLVGFEVFKRFVVHIDYAARQLTLTDPEHAPSPQGTAVPFTFDDRTPIVEGSIAGIPARFTIDTGARNSLTLNSPFVAKQQLIKRMQPAAARVTGWGVGGSVSAQPARVDALMLGSVRVDGVVAELFVGERGAFANAKHDGNVGAGVLRRFHVTFDYGKQTMWLLANEHIDERDGFDRAGMWFNLGEQGYTVVDVLNHGPAARAGVRVGDVLLALDGRAVSEWTVGSAREFLRATAPGTRVALRVLRNGREHALHVVLRETL